MKTFYISTQMRQLSAVLAFASAPLLLSACASYQKIKPAAVAMENVSIVVPDAVKKQQSVSLQDKWWQVFGDPQLDSLIEQALTSSPSMAIAHSRIARARAIHDVNRAAAAPQVGGTASASYGRQSGSYLVPKAPQGVGGTYVSQGMLGADFNYDIDIWGKYDAQIRAAQSQVDAAMFERDATRLSLAIAICKAYLQLSAQYELYDVYLAYQVQHNAVREVNRLRVKSGLDTEVELKQSETNQAILNAGLAKLGAAIEATRLQVAALVGGLPALAQKIHRPTVSNVPLTIPADLQLDLLGRRPDLAAQRARIRAAIGDVDAAEAQFYPNISLTGMLGFQSIGLENLLKGDSLTNIVGPALRLPIFDGGRLRANYAVKSADLDAAIAQYNQSVITSAQEVAELLTTIGALTEEEKFTRISLTSADEAYRLAMLRYRAGLSSYLTVLTVEMQMLFQRRESVELKARRHELQISLVRALGGGFIDESMSSASGQTPERSTNFNKMANSVVPALD